jgi:hypothetical protein
VEAFLTGARFLSPGKKLHFTYSFQLIIQILSYIVHSLDPLKEMAVDKASDVVDLDMEKQKLSLGS